MIIKKVVALVTGTITSGIGGLYSVFEVFNKEGSLFNIFNWFKKKPLLISLDKWSHLPVNPNVIKNCNIKNIETIQDKRNNQTLETFLNNFKSFIDNPFSLKDLSNEANREKLAILISDIEFWDKVLFNLNGKNGSYINNKLNTLVSKLKDRSLKPSDVLKYEEELLLTSNVRLIDILENNGKLRYKLFDNNYLISLQEKFNTFSERLNSINAKIEAPKTSVKKSVRSTVCQNPTLSISAKL
ncbi:MAG: hypothetical protein J0H68_06005 [Sphingobacteriia bacterium]|nr:hypothetical protein [Sphingobacteriia bacterium]